MGDPEARAGLSTAVAILGMHRTGTSMTTRALNILGVELGSHERLRGATVENPDGYWEHRGLMEVNIELLRRLGGDGRRVPELPERWWADAAYDDLRERARSTFREIGAGKPWGWKDPRTTLTFPFWRELIPNLRVVECVRHPLEVYDSLRRRHPCLTRAEGLAWWASFYEIFEANRGDTPVLVTDYAAWHHDARAETDRLCEFIGLEADIEAVQAAAASVRVGLYRNRRSEAELRSRNVPERVRQLYDRLLAAAGPVSRADREADAARERHVGLLDRHLSDDLPCWLRPRCAQHVLARKKTALARKGTALVASIHGRVVG
jgi:hypothetical protein